MPKPPATYDGFEGCTIEISPWSSSSVGFQGLELPKVYIAQFSLIDPFISKGKSKKARWFVDLVVELTDFATPELLEYRVKGTTLEYEKNQESNFYVGYAPDARAIQSWQSIFVSNNLKQFLLRAGIHVVQSTRKNGKGWTINHHADLVSKADIQEIKVALDNRLHQRLTPDFLREVATIYSQAVELDLQPTKYLMNHFKIPRATASRWVRGARNNNFLPEAKELGKPSKPNKNLTSPTPKRKAQK
jgi:hypothetical protein